MAAMPRIRRGQNRLDLRFMGVLLKKVDFNDATKTGFILQKGLGESRTA
jgi:hypothetical protein